MERHLRCILLLTLSAYLRVAHLQVPAQRPSVGSCPRLTPEDVGSTTTNFSDSGLVAEAIGGGGDVPLGQRQFLVRIVQPVEDNFQIVCEASGLTRDEISSVSFVLRYERCMATDCAGTTETLTQQFQFDCRETTGSFSPAVKLGGPTVTSNPMATLTTMLTTQCADCTEPGTFVTDPVTHCRNCSDECTGLGLCLGPNVASTGINRCCNFYNGDDCVINCPPGLVPDNETFDCGCEELATPANAADNVFSDRFLSGSTATQTCLPGFVSTTDTVTRTCQANGIWTGSDIVCNAFTCNLDDLDTPAFGTVDLQSSTNYPVGTKATFTCDTGRLLMGDRSRTCIFPTGWNGTTPTCVPMATTTVATTAAVATDAPSSSSCGTGCIVGIVLAVLGAIILAAILAGVAYAVYSYMNHPDTKLAKYDPDNINGVAKDNPLYVDPEAVVGDGAEAA